MKWFSFKAKAETGVEISIFDEIGMWGVSAKEFIAELKQYAGQAITLTINSPGGSVFDALAIYNALRNSGGEVTTKVMGVAASAASLIFMAGDKRVMPENTFLMIHNPMTGAYGNADEMRDIADVLDKIAASLIGTYVNRSGLGEAEVKALLDAETWLNAADSVAQGFATDMEAEMKIAASFDLARLPENVHAAFAARTDANGDGEVNDEQIENDEGGPEDDYPLDKALADEISTYASSNGLADYALTIALNPNVKSMADAKVFAGTVREIGALCALANKPDLAMEMVKAGVSVDQVRVKLQEMIAAEDAATHTSNVRKSGNSPEANSGASVWNKIFPPAA